MAIEIRGSAPLLQVFDMPTSVRFYRDLLGFAVASTDGRLAEECDWVLLRLGDVELMLNTAYEADERPAAPDPARIASHEDVCIFFDCPDVDLTYEHLSRPRCRGGCPDRDALRVPIIGIEGSRWLWPLFSLAGEPVKTREPVN